MPDTVVVYMPPQLCKTTMTTSTSTWSLPFDMPDDPEGLAGVREPRRPMPTSPAVCR